MTLDVVLLVGGLALLIAAADQFVLGASRVAHVWDVPPVVVGAVLMGFGTSAPELVVSVTAARQGDIALGVGNVVGSNVANLSLVLAAAALTTRLIIPVSTLRREAPLSVAATMVFAIAVWDGELSRREGVLLLVGLILVVGFLLAVGVSEGEDEPDGEQDLSGRRELGRVVLGLGGVVLAARLVVDGSTGLAEAWGLKGGFVGFSIVAVGTSLPELVTTLAAARRRETGLIVGNLLGS
ncbi:MAG: calcium/sodium antiporter, partial [Actinomycetota bacterium]|nr:calcium/sodium antiporter [Actinomycetota bacterium]